MSDSIDRPETSTPSPDLNYDNFRNAPSGLGPLAFTWKDKPHRLLYDLCDDAVRWKAEAERLRSALEHYIHCPHAELHCPCTETAKIALRRTGGPQK